MRDTIVGRHIRRASWNVIIANALLLGGVVVLFVATKTYWVNFVSGPFPIGWEELVALPNADGLQHYYVRIAGDRVVPTGVQTIEKTVSKWTNQVKQRVTADYAAVEIAGRWLVVKHAPDNPPGRSVVGTLQTAPGDVRERIMLAAERELRAPGLFLPLLLNTRGFHGRGHFMLAIGVPVALLAAWNLARASGRVRHPENHPAARRLGAF